MSLQLLTIQHWLKKHATYRPDHTAIVFGEQRLSYASLYKEVNRLSRAFLSEGIQKGDKVAILLPNSLELWEIYWACAATGAVSVPLSPLLKGNALNNLLENSDSRLLITSRDLLSNIGPFKETLAGKAQIWITGANTEGYTNYTEQKEKNSADPPEVGDVFGDDPYNIIYSSGTTGQPKGIIISHAVRALYGLLFSNAYRMTPESIVMHSGSVVFNGSFLTLMPAMYLGCTYVLMDHFDAGDVIDVIQKEKVTHTILVPSQIISCLQKPRFNITSLSTLEYILSVGAPLLLEHKQQLNRQIPGVFYELYGLTEGFMTILDKNDALRKTGSVGTPPQFMELKIVDDEGNELSAGQTGEIVGRGPLLMTGYYKSPEQTMEAIKKGWLYTGDLGYVDEEGYLFLTSRKKDLIISGGVNVYPCDIEEILIRHSAVKDVAVFGIPHNEWGETPVAAVVLNEDQDLNEEELKDWGNKNLEARYQKIYKVVYLEELPRNVAGKVLKRELKEKYREL